MKTSLLIVSAATILAAGCAVGPDYQKPATTTVPAHWGESLAGGEQGKPEDLSSWWHTFHDPELDSLVERALASNLDLTVAQARVREARARYGIAAAALAPAADAGASGAKSQASHHQPVLGSIPVPPSTAFENDVYQGGIDASWEIDVFGGRRRTVEAAKAEVAASEFGERATMMVLLGDVARTYVEVRGYQRRIAIADENIRAEEQGLSITRDRFAHGLSTDLDVEESSTVLAETKSEVPALESGLQASIHRLGVLLGTQPSSLITELSTPAALPAGPDVVPVGLPADLLLRRPDVLKAERQFAAATANIGIAESDLYPKFFLTGSAGYQSFNSGNWFSSASSFWQVGPTVQWRLFDAGQVRANIRVQDARQEEALATYEKTMLTAFEEVENSLVSYAKEQVRSEFLQQAVASSRQSLDLANRLYANGLTDFLRVVDAERSLYEAEDRFAQSEQAISGNLITLYESLGGGWSIQTQSTQQASSGALGAHDLPGA